jgi:PKD repeat protein
MTFSNAPPPFGISGYGDLYDTNPVSVFEAGGGVVIPGGGSGVVVDFGNGAFPEAYQISMYSDVGTIIQDVLVEGSQDNVSYVNLGFVPVSFSVTSTGVVGGSAQGAPPPPGVQTPYRYMRITFPGAPGPYLYVTQVSVSASPTCAVLLYPNPPVANFDWTPSTIYATFPVDFVDESTNSPTSWAWDFGDGGTSTLQNPSHVYATPGVYTVTLTATNSGGSSSPDPQNLTVIALPVPVASFTWTPSVVYPGVTVNFRDTSTNGPTSWSWTFGDGGTSTEQNPTHVYATVGIYEVTLVATNSSGSSSPDPQSLVVEAQPMPIPVPPLIPFNLAAGVYIFEFDEEEGTT